MKPYTSEDDSTLSFVKERIETIFEKIIEFDGKCTKQSLEADNDLIESEKEIARKKSEEEKNEIPLKELEITLSRLKGRNVEIQEYAKKIIPPERIAQDLDEIYAKLKKTPMNENIKKLADSISDAIEDGESAEDATMKDYDPSPDDDGSLFCFVNSEEVEGLKTNAIAKYKELEKKTKETNSSLESNIDFIERLLFRISKLDGEVQKTFDDAKSEGSFIKDLVETIRAQGKKVEIQYNRIRDIHAIYAINKAATVPVSIDPSREFNPSIEKGCLQENMAIYAIACKNQEEVKRRIVAMKEKNTTLKNLIKEYIKELNSIGTFKSQLKEKIKIIEKLFKEFEGLYRSTDDECSELLSLVGWYTNFLNMYDLLREELKRRVKAEQEIENEVELYRHSLKQKFETEVLKRKEFGREVCECLPTPLLSLVAEHPIRYEVYPINKKSQLLTILAHDEEIASYSKPKGNLNITS